MQVKINPLISWVWVGFLLTIIGTVAGVVAAQAAAGRLTGTR